MNTNYLFMTENALEIDYLKEHGWIEENKPAGSRSLLHLHTGDHVYEYSTRLHDFFTAVAVTREKSFCVL